MPHGLVVEHVARNPVDEGGHGRRGLEAVAEDGAIGAPAHLARVLGGDARRLLLRARQHHADPVEHDVLGRPHHLGGQGIVGSLYNVARENFGRAHRRLLTWIAGARSLAWRPPRGNSSEEQGQRSAQFHHALTYARASAFLDLLPYGRSSLELAASIPISEHWRA